MTYTFWHAGKLMGHADLSHNPSHPPHRAGILAPTPYGLTLLPRLTRFLTVTLAAKRLLESQNSSIDDLLPDEMSTKLAGTDVERTMRELGSLLVDMEVRDQDGAPRAVSMLSFSDTNELRHLSRELGNNLGERLKDVPPGVTMYIVSLTFRTEHPVRKKEKQKVH